MATLFAIVFAPLKLLWQMRPSYGRSCPVWLQPLRLHLFFLEMDVREAFQRWAEPQPSPQHTMRVLIILGTGAAVAAVVAAVYILPRDV